MNQNLRTRNSTSGETHEKQEEEKNEESNQNNKSYQKQNSEAHFISSIKWFIIICLFLTTVVGTYQSFSIHSKLNPGKPIHQITRLPTPSFLSTETIEKLKSLPYFAQKSNFFNQKFVKLGWAWTTFVIWFHSITLASFYFGSKTHQSHQPAGNQARSNSNSPADPIPKKPSHPSTQVPRIITLHFIASVLWIFLTQWFFGSSLIERILILSGAKCVPSSNAESLVESDALENAYCEQRWGNKLPGLDPMTLSTYRPYWSGGIDVSGHTFLLSFSIMVIISALQPSLIHLIKKDTKTENITTSYKIAIYVNLGLLILWWWMLLMTSLYFHGPTEKLFGLALGIGSWFFVESIVNELLG